MNKILKGAVVLLIAVTLFISTAVTANTEKEQFSAAGVSADAVQVDNTETEVFNFPNIEVMGGPSLFLQSPTSPYEDWYAYTSDLNSQYRCYDNFWDVNEPICDIHWWGLSLYWTGTEWIQCDPEGMLFEIAFFTDNGGVPGDLVCIYSDISPDRTFYDTYNSWSCYEWSYVLDPCCQLSNGWVSIAGSYSPESCWFLWMNSPDGDLICLQVGGTPEWKEDDLAFELTGEEECNPDINVKKDVWDPDYGGWVPANSEGTAVELPICEDAKFRIRITNTGDCPLDVGVDDKMHDSLKFRNADPEPDEVTYDPPFYYIIWVWPEPVQPGETVVINVTAHVEGPECSIDYNYAFVQGTTEGGDVVEDEDYAYVHAYKKGRDINTPLLNLLELLMNQFTILRALFGL